MCGGPVGRSPVSGGRCRPSARRARGLCARTGAVQVSDDESCRRRARAQHRLKLHLTWIETPFFSTKRLGVRGASRLDPLWLASTTAMSFGAGTRWVEHDRASRWTPSRARRGSRRRWWQARGASGSTLPARTEEARRPGSGRAKSGTCRARSRQRGIRAGWPLGLLPAKTKRLHTRHLCLRPPTDLRLLRPVAATRRHPTTADGRRDSTSLDWARQLSPVRSHRCCRWWKPSLEKSCKWGFPEMERAGFEPAASDLQSSTQPCGLCRCSRRLPARAGFSSVGLRESSGAAGAFRRPRAGYVRDEIIV
jgi:hypothetical protein